MFPTCNTWKLWRFQNWTLQGRIVVFKSLAISKIIFSSWKHQYQHIIKALESIPDFGVTTAILNTIDISRRWCRLDFGPLRDQAKSRHFPERIDATRQYFYYLYKFLGITGRKTLLDNDLNLYLLNGISLDLDLDNSFWIRKIPNFATNNINIWFFTQHSLS